jgi:molybdopterin converting factor small subunit
VRVRIAPFARLRELLTSADLERALPDGSTAEDAWNALAAAHPELRSLRASTRFAIGGAIVGGATPLRDGDELALLPPFGGG